MDGARGAGAGGDRLDRGQAAGGGGVAGREDPRRPVIRCCGRPGSGRPRPRHRRQPWRSVAHRAACPTQRRTVSASSSTGSPSTGTGGRQPGASGSPSVQGWKRSPVTAPSCAEDRDGHQGRRQLDPLGQPRRSRPAGRGGSRRPRCRRQRHPARRRACRRRAGGVDGHVAAADHHHPPADRDRHRRAPGRRSSSTAADHPAQLGAGQREPARAAAARRPGAPPGSPEPSSESTVKSRPAALPGAQLHARRRARASTSRGDHLAGQAVLGDAEGAACRRRPAGPRRR